MTDINVLKRQLEEAHATMADARAEFDAASAKLGKAAAKHSSLAADYLRRIQGAVRRQKPKLLPSLRALVLADRQLASDLDLFYFLIDPDYKLTVRTTRFYATTWAADLVKPAKRVVSALVKVQDALGPDYDIGISETLANDAAFKEALAAATKLPSRKNGGTLLATIGSLSATLEKARLAAEAAVKKHGEDLLRSQGLSVRPKKKK